jgi:hypothetical protein
MKRSSTASHAGYWLYISLSLPFYPFFIPFFHPDQRAGQAQPEDLSFHVGLELGGRLSGSLLVVMPVYYPTRSADSLAGFADAGRGVSSAASYSGAASASARWSRWAIFASNRACTSRTHND